MKKNIFTDLLIAVSLSNLLFVFGRGSIAAEPFSAYHILANSNSLIFQNTFILSILLLALFFFVLIRIDRWRNKGNVSIAGKLAFTLVFLCVVQEIKVYLLTVPQVAAVQNWINNALPRFVYVCLILFLGAGVIFLEIKRRGLITNAAKHFILILSPFFAVTLYYYASEMRSFYKSLELQAEFSDKTRLPPVLPQNSSTNRIVWIIFDEFDYRIAFESEPDKYPELRAFKEKSVSATQALPPAHDTRESIPSYFTGKQVDKTDYIGSNDLQLYFKDGNTGTFKTSQFLINDLSRSNKRIGIIGTYHPYCRIFPEALTFCIDYTSANLIDDSQSSVSTTLYKYLSFIKLHINASVTYFPFKYRFFGETPVFALPRQIIPEELNIKSTKEAIAQSKQLVAHPDFDFLFLHLLFPHSPFFYDEKTKTFAGEGNYLKNISLADDTLGNLRQSMENADLWNNSTIVVSSDHSWRLDIRPINSTDAAYQATNGGKYDPRIPFLIKMKHQQTPFVINKPINTVVTAEMIVKISNGEINTPEELVKFLENHQYPQ